MLLKPPFPVLLGFFVAGRLHPLLEAGRFFGPIVLLHFTPLSLLT